MNDYNQRQLISMLNQLEAYKSGSIDLASLISSLESLFNVLENMPEEWSKKMRSKWGVLEEVYSVAIIREQPVESRENRHLVDQAVNNIQELIESALAKA